MVTTVAMHIITKHSTADILTQEVNSANKSRFYGVMVSTLDFESSDPSSNLGRTYLFYSVIIVTPWRNGSASDSRSEGCVFESRRGHQVFVFLLPEKEIFCLEYKLIHSFMCQKCCNAKVYLPPMRIELMTFGLQDQRSATEL